MKNIQEVVLNFIEEEENSATQNYQNLIKLLNDLKIQQDYEDIKLLLHILVSISNNHHRSPFFFNKIEQILQYLKDDIIKNYSNNKIFNIFQENKRLILYLIKENILKLNDFTISKIKKKKSDYLEYFSPELNNEFKEKSKDEQDSFNLKREIGENDSYLCKLIREDSVEKFIVYVNKENLPLKSQIKSSIFETNTFLIGKEPELIEYAAFFGSIQIFQYLMANEVDLRKPLWMYSIHSNNAEIIYMLEENHIEPENINFIDCFNESIKCHHNKMAEYIKTQKFADCEINKENREVESVEEDEENFDFDDDDADRHHHSKYEYDQEVENILIMNLNCIENYNIAFIQSDFINEKYFIFFCQNEYDQIARILMKNKDVNVNNIRIPKTAFGRVVASSEPIMIRILMGFQKNDDADKDISYFFKNLMKFKKSLFFNYIKNNCFNDISIIFFLKNIFKNILFFIQFDLNYN